MIKVLIFIIIMGALVGFLWHDEMRSWLADFQNQAEEQAPGLINQGKDKAVDLLDQASEKWIDDFVANLTADGKVRIDAWLQEKNFNQYGDKLKTMYAGGTPLFNEATGQTIDRYVYLIKKFPDLINQLNLQQYLK